MEIEQNQDQQVTVSIIILTWNSERQIGACLASLDRGLSEFSGEVIVIDNGSQDQTCAGNQGNSAGCAVVVQS